MKNVNMGRTFGKEILESVRSVANEHLESVAHDEFIIGIERAVKAMIELNVSKEMIVKMLQKHWDLRLSEALSFVDEENK